MTTIEQKLTVPSEVSHVTETLQKAGFQAYLVGGCVRDLIMGRKPKDWDITTDAIPEQIQGLFSKTFYENDFGTVTVVQEDVSDETLKNIEITPFRVEGKYSNKRHPDTVSFSKNLNEDLQRRDFTINALAYNPNSDTSDTKGQLVDLYNGQRDIKDKTIVAVGNPRERFAEDALRMLRAVRLACELDFSISHETKEAIKAQAKDLSEIAAERIQLELNRIIDSPKPKQGIELCRELGLLAYMIPELEEGINIEQRGEHIYDVWEHNLRSLEHAGNREWPFHVRLAALLHDVAKPRTRHRDEARQIWTFHGHDVVGGRMTKEILKRLKYSNEVVDVVSKLVRYHLFFSDVDKITLSAVRRIVANVGAANVWDLMKVRACDRIGTGRPKEAPYRLRKYEAMIEEAMRAPVSVGMLKINGGGLIETFHVTPGPRIGWTLHALLEEVLDDPERNTEDYLQNKAGELLKLSDEDLQKLGEAGKEKKGEIEADEIKVIRKCHFVE